MISLYRESRSHSLGIEEIESYLEEKLSARVTVKKGLLRETHAQVLARLRVLDIYRPFTPNEPLPGEIAYEKRVLDGDVSPRGILYDGLRLQEIYREELPREERGLRNVHIIFTDRFIGTYDEDDRRYHGRVIVLGYPTVISLTGLVEAPAKPREYYIARRLGDAVAEKVLEDLGDRYLDYDDPRTPEVLKGYAMQGVFYQLLGEAFCPYRGCRLFNAHWQEEVLRAQLTRPEFCEKHGEMLKELRRKLKKFLRH